MNNADKDRETLINKSYTILTEQHMPESEFMRPMRLLRVTAHAIQRRYQCPLINTGARAIFQVLVKINIPMVLIIRVNKAL